MSRTRTFALSAFFPHDVVSAQIDVPLDPTTSKWYFVAVKYAQQRSILKDSANIPSQYHTLALLFENDMNMPLMPLVIYQKYRSSNST